VTVSGQIVDTETAREFMTQTLEKITQAELGDIAGELERKTQRFQELLSPVHLPILSEDELVALLRHMFATRRKARQIAETQKVDFFRAELPALLYGTDDPPRRLQAFVDALGGFTPQGVNLNKDGASLPENVCSDVASELLHFTSPENHWLWTRWMWDPKPGTGALPLVVEDEYDLSGISPGEIYTKVGVAVAFVRATGDASGFTRLGRGPYGVDVFLACVYAIYMYTTLRLRMTQEFNKVVPPLPELVRRLLGVWRFDL
jgi:hypothetical protein